jgi:aminoglycoside 3-N-acetyltransferase
MTLAPDKGRVANRDLTREPVIRNQAAADPLGSRKGVNRKRLETDLHALGVPAGRPLLVHASLSHIGHVKGGANTVIAALLAVLGANGTLVTGAGTPENSTTSRAFHALTDDLTQDRVDDFLAKMRPFNQETTPTSVGAIAEALRTTPGARRSAHPQSSFAAVGREARELMAGHRVRCHLGEDSPLAKLYDRDALILMLGVDYRACSALHLAEYRYRERPPKRVYSCVVKKWGKTRWLYYRDVALDDDDFEKIGHYLECVLAEQGAIRRGRVGRAESCLIPMRSVVDLASEWMAENRLWKKTTPGRKPSLVGTALVETGPGSAE